MVLCLVPAFFIAGAIGVFVNQESVMKYLGAKANRALAYGVASVSGTILAVCSCTVLPLFAGIYRMGTGLGPACAFLYSGPAINVLAIVLTARILGLEMGIARAAGAVVFSVVIGLLMHILFRKEEKERHGNARMAPHSTEIRPLWKTALYFTSMVGILVFANWGKPLDPSGMWNVVYSMKWWITSAFAAGLGLILVAWFRLAWWKVIAAAVPPMVLAVLFPSMPVLAFGTGALGLSVITATDRRESADWFAGTWGFLKQILPLLLAGVLVAGILLGRVGHEGIMPSKWISSAVGGNSPWANFSTSIAGAFMYFATLTEVPILQGLMANGMGKGDRKSVVRERV